MKEKNLIQKFADSGAGPTSLIVTGIGFFGDFVKPYFNFIPLFLLLSAIASGIWWFAVTAPKRKKLANFESILATAHGKVLGVLLISTLYWGVLTPIFLLSPQQGFAATLSPTISDWQESLFGKLDRIEQKLDSGIEQILAKIDQVDQKAGLISNPSSANDYYHNARIQEISGNLLEARQSYQKVIAADLSYFDPYLSYYSILKNLEGPSSARQIIGELRTEFPQNAAAQLIHAISKESREDQFALLQRLTQQFPDYGPIYYYLIMHFSFQENGLATNEEKKSQRAYLEKFNQLEKEQLFSKFIIDKNKSEEMLKEISAQSKMTEGMLGKMIDKPIDIKITPLNKSVSIAFIPTELVQKIFYRLNQQGEFKDTGDSGISMVGQDYTLPNYQVMEALPIGEHQIEVKYQDSKGNTSPVYSFPVKIEDLTLNYPPYKMIDPQTGQAQYLVSWSLYDSNAEYDLKYSLNNSSLDQTVESVLYLKNLPSGKHTLYMQGINKSNQTKTNLATMEFTINE